MPGRKTSFPAVVDKYTVLLVLGSLPGDRSLTEQRYYAHPQNQFWRLMSGAVGVDLSVLGYEQRLAALLAAGVGLWDVIGAAARHGSTDAAIRDVETNDLTGLIVELPKLRAIAFNGGTALTLGRRLLRLASLSPAVNTLDIVALPSSSALNTVGIAAKQPAWDRLAVYLG